MDLPITSKEVEIELEMTTLSTDQERRKQDLANLKKSFFNGDWVEFEGLDIFSPPRTGEREEKPNGSQRKCPLLKNEEAKKKRPRIGGRAPVVGTGLPPPKAQLGLWNIHPNPNLIQQKRTRSLP